MTVENQTENLEQNQIKSGIEPNGNLENMDETLDASALVETDLDLTEDEPEPYDEMNLELESFLSNATTTKAETQANEREANQQAKQQQKEQELIASCAVDEQEAAGYAVQFMGHVVNAAREYTGKDINLKPFHYQVGATLFIPAIMKHGPAVKRYIQSATSGVDEESNIPEYLAGGTLAAMAGYLWYQARNARPIPKDVNTKV